jgi:hypothetical protein
MNFAIAQRAPQRARMLGMSLIELMTALVIGLLLIAGALTVYMQSRNSYRTTDSAARMQETARNAFDIIEPGRAPGRILGHEESPAAVTDVVPFGSVTGNCGNVDGWLGDATKYVGAFDSSWGGMVLHAHHRLDARREHGRAARAARVGRNQRHRHQQDPGESNRAQASVFTGANRARRLRHGAGRRDARHGDERLLHRDVGHPVSLRRKALRGKAMVDEEVIPDVQNMQVQFGIDADGDGAAEKYVTPARSARQPSSRRASQADHTALRRRAGLHQQRELSVRQREHRGGQRQAPAHSS